MTGTVRLFVAVFPPAQVVGSLQDLPRSEIPAHLRWTAPPTWHVTLAFLGNQEREAIPEIAVALEEVGRDVARPRLRLGPATEVMSRRTLVVPVEGVDALAQSVLHRMRPWMPKGADLPFRGHLTLARPKGRGRLTPDAGGTPLDLEWVAEEFTLTRSVPGREGSTYFTERAVALM